MKKNHTMKSNCLKFIVKKILPIIKKMTDKQYIKKENPYCLVCKKKERAIIKIKGVALLKKTASIAKITVHCLYSQKINFLKTKI